MYFGGKSLLLFSIFLVLVALFQNCAKSSVDSHDPKNDPVSKAETPKETDGLDQQDDELLLYDLNAQVLPQEKVDEVRTKIRECERLLGSQRVDCVRSSIEHYYSELSHYGFSVVSGYNCILAYKRLHQNSILFDSTCHTSSSRDGRAGLHLGECIDSSAVTFYRHGRNFERLHLLVNYRVAYEKTAEIYQFNPAAPIFFDACKKEHHATSLGISVDL